MNDNYLTVILERFKVLKELGEKTFNQLDNAAMHYTPNEASNSIAILIQHLNGNMISRWTDFLTTDGEKSDRKRNLEFVDQKLSKEKLLELWEDGWKTLISGIESLTSEDLEKNVVIKGKTLSVIEAIETQLAHHAMHIGQIQYIGKIVLNDDWKTLSIPKK